MKIEENTPVIDSTPAANLLTKLTGIQTQARSNIIILLISFTLSLLSVWGLSKMLTPEHERFIVITICVLHIVFSVMMYINGSTRIKKAVAEYRDAISIASRLKIGDKFTLISIPVEVKQVPENEAFWKLDKVYTVTNVMRFTSLPSEIWVGDNWIDEEYCLPYKHTR